MDFFIVRTQSCSAIKVYNGVLAGSHENNNFIYDLPLYLWVSEQVIKHIILSEVRLNTGIIYIRTSRSDTVINLRSVEQLEYRLVTYKTHCFILEDSIRGDCLWKSTCSSKSVVFDTINHYRFIRIYIKLIWFIQSRSFFQSHVVENFIWKYFFKSFKTFQDPNHAIPNY